MTNTHVNALEHAYTGRMVFGTWFYALDTIAIRVVYAEPDFQDRNGMIGAWRPTTAQSRIRVIRPGG